MSFNVLICDDSTIARKMARRALPEGFAASVVDASNGMDALEILASQHIDLLVLDLTMPELDGIGVLQAIKARQHKVFVVVVSGDIQPTMQQRVMDLGALAFLSKPVNASTLNAVLVRYGFAVEDAVAS